MNPEQFLTKCAEYIETFKPAASGMYTLQIVDKSVKLFRGSSQAGLDGVLAILTSVDINNGLTTKQWNRIRDRFAIFQKRGLI